MATVIRRGGNPFSREEKGFEGSNPSIKNANPSFSYPIDIEKTHNHGKKPLVMGIFYILIISEKYT